MSKSVTELANVLGKKLTQTELQELAQAIGTGVTEKAVPRERLTVKSLAAMTPENRDIALDDYRTRKTESKERSQKFFNDRAKTFKAKTLDQIFAHAKEKFFGNATLAKDHVRVEYQSGLVKILTPALNKKGFVAEKL